MSRRESPPPQLRHQEHFKDFLVRPEWSALQSGKSDSDATVLVVGDTAAAWRSAGFTVEPSGLVRFGGAVSVHLQGVGMGRGILGWTLGGYDSSAAIDGIPILRHDFDGVAAPDSAEPSSPHPNGVGSVDCIVLHTPDWVRTRAALRQVGLDALRQSTETPGMMQLFYRVGCTMMQVVAPLRVPDGRDGCGPARVSGIIFVTADVDSTHACLAGSTKPPWAAAQPGRRLTALQGEEHAISVAISFVSPAVDSTSDPFQAVQEEAAGEVAARDSHVGDAAAVAVTGHQHQRARL